MSGVTASDVNGSYKAGQTIHVQVNLSEPVTVTGTPQLALNTSEAAVYASGSGTSTLAFDYLVQAGDNAATLDYAATTALTLSGGTIRDTATNDATLTLAAPGTAGSLGNSKSITVDTTAPVVDNVTSSTANGAYKAGQTIQVQVNFSEPVTVTGTPQLLLETGATDRERRLRLRLGHPDAHLRLHRPVRRHQRRPRLPRHRRPDPQRRHHRRPGRQQRRPHPLHPRRRRLARRQQGPRRRHHRPDRQRRHVLNRKRRIQGRPDHPRPGQLQRARHRHRHPAARPQHEPRRVGCIRLR